MATQVAASSSAITVGVGLLVALTLWLGAGYYSAYVACTDSRHATTILVE